MTTNDRELVLEFARRAEKDDISVLDAPAVMQERRASDHPSRCEGSFKGTPVLLLRGDGRVAHFELRPLCVERCHVLVGVTCGEGGRPPRRSAVWARGLRPRGWPRSSRPGGG
jgi:hypothetical protein